MLLPLVYLQRLLHREIQAVFFLITRNINLSLGLFSVLFFPGVLLHELSHLIMAKILGVRTGDFSLVPHPLPDGRLQMGYVETEETDIIRDSLIGLAPLIAGMSIVAYVGIYRFQFHTLIDFVAGGQFDLFFQGLVSTSLTQDFYVWFYLAFSVSSTMIPSETDRAALLPLGVLTGLLVGLAVLSGAGEWMLNHLAPLLDNFLGSASLLLGVGNLFHLSLLLPFYLFHKLLVYITQVDVA